MLYSRGATISFRTLIRIKSRSCTDGLSSVCRTLYVLLEDILERGKESFLEAGHSLGTGEARDADGDTYRLKQVVVEVRLARVLESEWSG